jgi:trk system potassium uptake protein
VRVVIAGGGKVGRFIASQLGSAGHDVLVLERDPSTVAEGMAEAGPGVVWQRGDACEVSALDAAHVSEADVVAAVTGDDEDNVVIALLAKQEFGVPRCVARVNDPDNEWMFNESWGVDVAVSTPHLLTGLVTQAVSVGTLTRLLSLGQGEARLDEITLAESSPAVGHEIQGLGFPRDSTVVAVLRQQRVVVPRGDTVLRAGDEVLVLVTESSEEQVREVLTGA